MAQNSTNTATTVDNTPPNPPVDNSPLGVARANALYAPSNVVPSAVKYGWNLEPVRSAYKSRLETLFRAGQGGSILITAADSIAEGTIAADPFFGIWSSMLWDTLHQRLLGRARKTLGFVPAIRSRDGDQAGDNVRWPLSAYMGTATVGPDAAKTAAFTTTGARFLAYGGGFAGNTADQQGVTFKALARTAGADTGRFRIDLDPLRDPRFQATSVTLIAARATNGGSQTWDIMTGSNYGAFVAIGGGGTGAGFEAAQAAAAPGVPNSTGTINTQGATASAQFYTLASGLDPTVRRSVQIGPTGTAQSSSYEGLYVCNGDERKGFHVVNLGRYSWQLRSFLSSEARIRANVDVWCDGTAAYRNAVLLIAETLSNEAGRGAEYVADFPANVDTLLARVKATVSKPVVLWMIPVVQGASDPTFDANVLGLIAIVKAKIQAASTDAYPMGWIDLNSALLDRDASLPYTLAEVRAAQSTLGFSPDNIHPGEVGQAFMAELMVKALG